MLGKHTCIAHSDLFKTELKQDSLYMTNDKSDTQ